MIIALLFSILIVTVFISAMVYSFGIQENISTYFYCLEEWHIDAGVLFFWFAVLSAFLAIPFWLEVSTENTQFLAFLACAGLVFVGAASRFKVDLTGKVHYTAAIICISSSILWLICSGLWIVPLFIFAGLGWVSYKKGNLMFWGELAGFISIYIGLIVKAIWN